MDLEFRTIKEICDFLGADFQTIKRGFQTKGAIDHPTENYTVWWPTAIPSKSGWCNSINLEKTEIVETQIDEGKQEFHVNSILNHARPTRIVFFKENRKSLYKFIGVFEIDRAKTTIHAGVIWKKIGNEFKMP